MDKRIYILLTDIAHILFGILGALFNPYIFTTIFLVKQVFDYISHKEVWTETSRDISEYSIGLITGYFIKQFIVL